MVWRQTPGIRLAGYATILALVYLVIGAVIQIQRADRLAHPLVQLLLLTVWVALLLVVVLQLRSYVRLTDSTVVVQNPIRRYEMALPDIKHSGGSQALFITTRSGTVVRASAIAATFRSGGQRQRIELVAKAIREAAARAPGAASLNPRTYE